MKKVTIAVGFTAGLTLLAGCSGRLQSRLEGDFGTSKDLAVFNQIANPEAETNLKAVEGLDAQASENNLDKYRQSFAKEKQTTTYTINLGK
jgi:type IV pilus biogenesis protein CpaD/CtpE